MARVISLPRSYVTFRGFYRLNIRFLNLLFVVFFCQQSSLFFFVNSAYLDFISTFGCILPY